MSTKIYILLLLISGFFTISLRGQDRITTKPDSAGIITSDIDQFWRAFDMLPNQTSTADSVRIIETIFVNQASEGLQQYMKAANCYADCYLDAIRQRRTDYLKVRAGTETLADKKKILVQYLHKFKQLFPSLKIPVICFTMGKFEVGGTQFENTLYIGCEVDFLQNTDITAQTIHEIAHFQQKKQKKGRIEIQPEFIQYPSPVGLSWIPMQILFPQKERINKLLP